MLKIMFNILFVIFNGLIMSMFFIAIKDITNIDQEIYTYILIGITLSFCIRLLDEKENKKWHLN